MYRFMSVIAVLRSSFVSVFAVLIPALVHCTCHRYAITCSSHQVHPCGRHASIPLQTVHMWHTKMTRQLVSFSHFSHKCSSSGFVVYVTNQCGSCSSTFQSPSVCFATWFMTSHLGSIFWSLFFLVCLCLILACCSNVLATYVACSSPMFFSSCPHLDIGDAPSHFRKSANCIFWLVFFYFCTLFVRVTWGCRHLCHCACESSFWHEPFAALLLLLSWLYQSDCDFVS